MQPQAQYRHLRFKVAICDRSNPALFKSGIVLDGARTVEDSGDHYGPVLGEDERELASATAASF
jgi:hypothetical protein